MSELNRIEVFADGLPSVDLAIEAIDAALAGLHTDVKFEMQATWTEEGVDSKKTYYTLTGESGLSWVLRIEQ